jgi:hypothetical protein
VSGQSKQNMAEFYIGCEMTVRNGNNTVGRRIKGHKVCENGIRNDPRLGDDEVAVEVTNINLRYSTGASYRARGIKIIIDHLHHGSEWTDSYDRCLEIELGEEALRHIVSKAIKAGFMMPNEIEPQDGKVVQLPHKG